MVERNSTTTIKETITLTDSYYRLNIYKTNGVVERISVTGNKNRGERVLAISKNLGDRSVATLQCKIEELRDLLNKVLLEMKEETS